MKKYIEIERCNECPCRKFHINELDQYTTCEKVSIKIRETDIESLNKTGFPSWCPLKDIKE